MQAAELQDEQADTVARSEAACSHIYHNVSSSTWAADTSSQNLSTHLLKKGHPVAHIATRCDPHTPTQACHNITHEVAIKVGCDLRHQKQCEEKGE